VGVYGTAIIKVPVLMWHYWYVAIQTIWWMDAPNADARASIWCELTKVNRNRLTLGVERYNIQGQHTCQAFLNQ